MDTIKIMVDDAACFQTNGVAVVCKQALIGTSDGENL